MNDAASSFGFIAILLLYGVVGITCVIGAATVTRKLFAPRWESVVYAVFLVAVAGFYIPFMAYFRSTGAWPMELTAILVFAVIALLGLWFPVALIAGYSLHGVWDLLHELQAHGAAVFFAPGQATEIPLAYGVFCAAFDVGIAVYFCRRRAEWNAARTRHPA